MTISLCVASLGYLLFLFYVRALGVWGELASHKRLFNPPPQFSRLGTQGPALVLLSLCCVVRYCMLHCGDGGGYFFLFFFL